MSASDYDSKRIAQIKERLSKITPGPWKWKPYPHNGAQDGAELSTVAEFRHAETFHGPIYLGVTYSCNNAAFIASAPEDIAYLLALLEAQE